MSDLRAGDYVLATKYRDGDPQDHWVVGYFVGTLHKASGVRYEVADGAGQLFRANGFRRVQKISPSRGRWLLEHKQDIEHGGRSVWWWVRARMASNAGIQPSERSEDRLE